MTSKVSRGWYLIALLNNDWKPPSDCSIVGGHTFDQVAEVERVEFKNETESRTQRGEIWRSEIEIQWQRVHQLGSRSGWRDEVSVVWATAASILRTEGDLLQRLNELKLQAVHPISEVQ